MSPIRAGEAVDTSTQVATAQTTHLSPYGLHSKSKGGGNDSGSDATSADDGSTSDDGGIQDAGFDANGCTPVAQQVGSCANHPVQICTVGKVFSNCKDLMPQGYSAYCCPASL